MSMNSRSQKISDHYIATPLQQVTALLSHQGLEASLEHMPHLSMAPVEPLGIDPVELPHPGRAIASGRLEEQMVVVVH